MCTSAAVQAFSYSATQSCLILSIMLLSKLHSDKCMNVAQPFRYLNNTGLMWESAQEFGALLVFAEHRYYGESKPYTDQELKDNMQYLTAEQAMADYAELLTDLKSELKAEDCPVIGFGGSYGGMLAAWMRMKYPHILTGAIAASAPIWYTHLLLFMMIILQMMHSMARNLIEE